MARFKAVEWNRASSHILSNNFAKILTTFVLLSALSAASAAPLLSRISCGHSAFNTTGTDACSVYLASPTGSRIHVILTSNNPAVRVPGGVTIKSGASTTGFSAAVASVTVAQTATITAQAGGITTTFVIALSPATGTAALTLSASSVAFGNVSIGSSATAPVAVSSSGTAPVTISSISVAGSLFGAVGVATPITLNPGQTAIMTVTFSPLQPSPGYNYTGLVTINSNASPATVSLAGAGVATLPTVSAVSCSSTSITGSLADACSVSLSGPAPTGGLSVSLASSSSAVTVPASVSVTAGASTAAFTASVASVTSAQSDTVTAMTGSTSRGVSLQLNAATPALTLNATSLSFGNVSVGTAVTKSITVTSSGTVAVTLNSDSISGTGYSVSGGSFPATLNPGQAAVLTVQFDPTSAGSSTGQLTIASNAPAASVSLSGTGTTITPTVSAISCSSTSITGSLADACTVSLSGSAPTGGLSVSMTSSSNSVTVPSSITVPATATSAAFSANVASVTSAQSVTLTAATGSTSRGLSLQLNAATPTLSLNASSIAFGAVVVNNATTQSLTLTSTGTAPVTVSSVAVTGSGFSASPVSLPATLNPGQAITVTLTFDPTAVGAASGQLTVSSNSSTNATASVSLSGTGNPHQVDLSWAAPTGSTDPIAGYKVYRAPGGTSSFAAVVSMDTQTAYTDSNVQGGQSYNYYVTSVDSSGVESAPSNMTTVAVP